MQNLSSGIHPKTNRNLSVKTDFEDYEILDIDFEEVQETDLSTILISGAVSAVGWTLVGTCRTFEFILPLVGKSFYVVFVCLCRGVHLFASSAWDRWSKGCPANADSPSVHVETNVHADGANVHVETNVFVNR